MIKFITLILLPIFLYSAPVCKVHTFPDHYKVDIYSGRANIPDVTADITIPKLYDLRVTARKQTTIQGLNSVEVEEGIKNFTMAKSYFKVEADINTTKHSVNLSFDTIVGKSYTVYFKADHAVWVWFSDNVRQGHNPAKLTGGTGKIITLDPFKAKNKITTLYLQMKTDKNTTISDIGIK